MAVENKEVDVPKHHVKTIGETIELRKECRLIKGNYHLVGRDCFFIRGKYTSIYYNKLAIDHNTGEYDRRDNLTSCIVGFDPVNNKLIKGYASNVTGDFTITDGNGDRLTVSNEKVFKTIPLEECVFSGEWFIKGHSPYKKPLRWDRNLNQFNCSDSLRRNFSKVSLGESSLSHKAFNSLKYSFGVELETSMGIVTPKTVIEKGLNIHCERDGSIGAGEYVTGVLTGDSGLLNLKKTCIELSKRTSVDLKCGTHVHIGGANFNEQFNILAYILALKIEKSLFAALPVTRKMGYHPDTGNLGDNVYCKPIPNLYGGSVDVITRAFDGCSTDEGYSGRVNKLYDRFFEWISCGIKRSSVSSNPFTKQHPKGPKCGYVKDTPRYCWLNFVPSNFNTRGNGTHTLEFRAFSETTNYLKVKNWVMFSMAFVYFVENNMRAIISSDEITIIDILKAAYGSNSPVVDYYKRRIAFFEEDHARCQGVSKLPTRLLKESDFEVSFDEDLTLKSIVNGE